MLLAPELLLWRREATRESLFLRRVSLLLSVRRLFRKCYLTRDNKHEVETGKLRILLHMYIPVLVLFYNLLQVRATDLGFGKKKKGNTHVCITFRLVLVRLPDAAPPLHLLACAPHHSPHCTVHRINTSLTY